jgi:hypothetical protein
VTADLKTYGQVFRFPVSDGPRPRRFAPGQPTFLLVEQPDDGSFRPAIWAVGEIVAELTERVDGSTVAEVELLPLQERIRLTTLADHEVLRGSELFHPPDTHQPLRLTRTELRSLEEWDFDFRPPTPEQEAALAEALHEVEVELRELYGDP